MAKAIDTVKYCHYGATIHLDISRLCFVHHLSSIDQMVFSHHFQRNLRMDFCRQRSPMLPVLRNGIAMLTAKFYECNSARGARSVFPLRMSRSVPAAPLQTSRTKNKPKSISGKLWKKSFWNYRLPELFQEYDFRHSSKASTPYFTNGSGTKITDLDAHKCYGLDHYHHGHWLQSFKVNLSYCITNLPQVLFFRALAITSVLIKIHSAFLLGKNIHYGTIWMIDDTK